MVETVNHMRTQDDFDDQGNCFECNYAILALLDVSKAFDRLDRCLIVDRLHKLGVHGRLFSCLLSYFHDRRQCVKIGDAQSDFVSTRNGGPQGSTIVLFVFLLYINDVCDSIHESEFALFIDDISLMICDPNPENLIHKLNADLNRLFGWSVFNRMVFDSEKFHLLDIGARKLSKCDKSKVHFGDSFPKWSKSAKYLGVFIDDKLTFLDSINYIIQRIETSMWRLYNHGNISTGASPYVLLNIFRTWILPLFEYGSCLWIFIVFDRDVCLGKAPDRGYITVFNKLDSLYAKCCKLILGVPISSCNISVYVRLGILPLRFHLVWRALVWYLKASHGSASKVVQRQLFSYYENDEIWMRSCFYNPAFRILSYLGRHIDVSFWGVRIEKASMLIRESLFKEADIFWRSSETPAEIKSIHPKWIYFKFNRINHSRFTSSLFHSCVLGRAKFRGFLHKCGSAPAPVCRQGCPDLEDIHHVFFHCHKSKKKINELKKKFEEKKINFNLHCMFTSPEIQIDVEKFLYEFFA